MRTSSGVLQPRTKRRDVEVPPLGAALPALGARFSPLRRLQVVDRACGERTWNGICPAILEELVPKAI